MTIRRSAPIRRSRIKRSSKRIPKINKAKQAKKLAQYQAFMRSPEWKAIRKAALERAGFRCEAYDATKQWRCSETTTLQVHHVRYSRFGGRELPRDLMVCCKRHHEAIHALKGLSPMWQRGAA